MLPDDLDAVEFRAVGRQVVKVQSLTCPAAPLFLHRLAFVNGRVIEQHNAWHRMRLVGNLIEKGDDVFASGRSLLRSPNQLAIMAQCAKQLTRCRCASGSTDRVSPIRLQPYCNEGFGLKPASSKYINSHRCSWSSRPRAWMILPARSNASWLRFF